MKRIYFVRHAKSSWKDMSLSDMERPLNSRGKRDAPFMSTQLAERVKDIDVCIRSPSKRTIMTSKEFKKVFTFKEILTDERIYHGSASDLMEVIHNISDLYASAVVFGHNPAYTYLHNHFATSIIDNLPTCGIFELICDVQSWKDVNNKNSQVGFVIYPKMFEP